jgi:hypothetical protein
MIDRCTNATLQAFGIAHPAPVRDIPELRRLLRANGYHVGSYAEYLDYIGGTLAAFVAAHQTGSFVIATSAHAMALINGVLHDAANGTGRRKIESIYPVSRS